MSLISTNPNTFTTARLKLTAYYTASITLIILILTFTAFNAKESSFISVRSAVGETVSDDNAVVQFQKSFDEFNRIFRQRLIFADIAMIIVAAAVSWWMSGKTLKPVDDMLKEQKHFAADVSHELRTPLANIQLEIQTTQKLHPKMPKNLQTLLVSVSEEVTRMTHMVQGLLLLVRSNQAHTSQEFELIKLSSIITRATESMQPLASQKNITIRTRFTHRPQVSASFDQLLQVVLILIDNAIKYSPKDSTITVRLDADKSAALLSVADQGYGIPEDDQKAIFQRFYRSGSIGDTKAKGSGLGLAIAHRIITNHQGTINIVSKPDQGSTFTIRIPLI